MVLTAAPQRAKRHNSALPPQDPACNTPNGSGTTAPSSRWAEATTHVMSHALHYGSSVFEGIRSYETPKGPAIFRLTDHNRACSPRRKIYDMAMPYSLEQINAACREVLKANGN